MSQIATHWATNQVNISWRAKFILMVLAFYADDENYFCSLTKRQLAASTGLSMNSVSLCLKELKGANLIKKKPRYDEKRVQLANSYWILINNEGGKL
jgi:hypothetical protein